MDCTIYLNDRKYRIIDTGEGKCTLVLCYAKGIESLFEHSKHQFVEMERVIVIDMSICWGGDVDSLNETQRSTLFEDVHLLCDIYWLDDFEVRTDKGKVLIQAISTPLLPTE